MRILYLIQYFGTPEDPVTSDRAFDFVNEFARKGHDVTVITSNAFMDSSNTIHHHLEQGVIVEVINQPYQNTFKPFQRGLAFASFFLRAFFRALMVNKTPDIIYASSTPLSVALLGALLHRLWKIPWIFEVRDLWPDFLFEINAIQNNWIQSFLTRLEGWLYKSANHIISLSPNTTDVLLNDKDVAANQITTLPNGCPYPYPEPTRSKVELIGSQYKNHYLFLYAGTLGQANNVSWIVEVFDLILEKKNTFVSILGEGSEVKLVESWVNSLPKDKAKRVLFDSFIPRKKASNWFWASDFSLISFNDLPSLAATSPNKYFHAIATGSIPITNHPGWISNEIELHQCGIAADNPHEVQSKLSHWLTEPNTLSKAHDELKELYHNYRRDKMAQNLLQIMHSFQDHS